MNKSLLNIRRGLRAVLVSGLLLATLLTAGCPYCRKVAPQETPAPETATFYEDPRLSEVFANLQAEHALGGAFVLYDREQNLLIGCNLTRAGARFQPASTFKILNALIAFETGVVSSADEILPYGGGPQPVKAWEQDMNIREAMAMSNVPLFQGIARRIGLERMRDYVARAVYGNAQIGGVVDNFWLKGPLAISILEQISFIDRLSRAALPFSPRSLELLRDIMPRESGPAQTIVYFKTGRASTTRPGIGWVVGWVHKDGQDYPFALNLDINKDEDADLRLTVTWQALQALGLY